MDRYSELQATAKAAGDVPFATIYVPPSPGDGNIVVCSNTIIKVGYREQDGPISIPWDSPSETLGQRVWEALLEFGRTPESNLKPYAERDWPAYRASGCKSLSAFVDEFLEVRVRVTSFLWAGTLCVEARVPNELLPMMLRRPRGTAGLLVGRDIGSNCTFESLGDLILLVCRCGVYVPNHFQFRNSATFQKW
jgi:hypothetical protein